MVETARKLNKVRDETVVETASTQTMSEMTRRFKPPESQTMSEMTWRFKPPESQTMSASADSRKKYDFNGQFFNLRRHVSVSVAAVSTAGYPDNS